MTPLFILAALSAFNLTCVTEYISFDGGPPKKQDGNTGPTFRINLETRRYCGGDCSETKPIARVTPTELILEAQESGQIQESLEINRESGSYRSIIRAGSQPPFIAIGTCRASAFTGFPAVKF